MLLMRIILQNWQELYLQERVEVFSKDTSIVLNNQNNFQFNPKNFEQFRLALKHIIYTTNCIFNILALQHNELCEIKFWKKYTVMLFQDERWLIELETLGLELFQFSNQRNGATLIFYQIYFAIQNSDYITNKTIKELFITNDWKKVSDNSYAIFGPYELLGKCCNKSIVDFNKFIQSMIEIGISEGELCSLIKLYLACIILGGIKVNAKEKEFGDVSTSGQLSQSSNGNFSTMSSLLIDKLDGILELNEELKLDELTDMTQISIWSQISSKDNRTATIQFIQKIIQEWYFAKIRKFSQQPDRKCQSIDIKYQIIEKGSPVQNLTLGKQDLNFIDVVRYYCNQEIMRTFFENEYKKENDQFITAINKVFSKNENYPQDFVVSSLNKLFSINPKKLKKSTCINLTRISSKEVICVDFENLQKENCWWLITDLQRRVVSSKNLILQVSDVAEDAKTTMEYLRDRLQKFQRNILKSMNQFNSFSQESSKFQSEKDSNSSHHNSDAESIDSQVMRNAQINKNKQFEPNKGEEEQNNICKNYIEYEVDGINFEVINSQQENNDRIQTSIQ